MHIKDIDRATHSFWHSTPTPSGGVLTFDVVRSVFEQCTASPTLPDIIVMHPDTFHAYCDLWREAHAAHMAELAHGAMRILGDTSPTLTDEEIVAGKRWA